MRGVNKVTLVGNLGADPEVRSTAGGKRVATLSLATSRKWKNRDGEPQEKTEWHRVVLWDVLADIAEQYLTKGSAVYVEGEIQYRKWDDKEGVTRYTTEINGRELVMLSGRGEASPERALRDPVRAAAAKAPGGGDAQTFENFPEALDDDDDDLPF